MLRIFKNSNFRFVLLYMVVFSLSVFGLGWMLFGSISNSVEEQTRKHIEMDVAQLMGDYEDDGLEELRHDIRERIEAKPSARLLYSISAPSGRVIFDNISPLPTGWHETEMKDGRKLLLKSVELKDGYQMLVAADLSNALDIQAAIRNSFAAAILLTLLVGIAGGWMVSRRFLSKVENVRKIAEEIGHNGDLSRRLPLSGTGDDFDQLALIVNNMLTRIEALVSEVKKVTTNIAHDLRTPLGRIRQRLEHVSQEKDTSPQVKQELEYVLMQLDHTLETFSSLLRIAEIESGSHKAGFTGVNLSYLIRNLASMYLPVAEDEDKLFLPEIEPGHFVYGDIGLLNQMFVNLLENAIRYSPPKARIDFWLKKKRDGIIEVMVANTGPGVPPEEWENIFKPFYRLDQSRTDGGSGLGLSFVAAIAALHGAKINVERGIGFEINIRFPHKKPPEEQGQDQR